MPLMEQYDRTTDPTDHVNTFTSLMVLHQIPDEVMCCAFPPTLKKSAQVWFSKLPPVSISLFGQLSKKFMTHFIGMRRQSKTSATLMTVKQKVGETLRDYISRFNGEALEVSDLDQSVALAFLMSGVAMQSFRFSLLKNPPQTYSDLLKKAEKYINTENTFSVRQEGEKERSTEKRKDREEHRDRPKPRRKFSRREGSSRGEGEEEEKKDHQ